MKFKKEDLTELAYGGWHEDLEIISDEHIDNNRWSENRLMIFRYKKDGRTYGVEYSRGLTELQCEAPFEYSPDEVECDEFIQEPYTTIRWVKAK